jgi:hypothetical protein
MIPTFAAIYSALPFHFYHQTVIYEQSIKADAERLALDLKDTVVANFRSFHHESTFTRDHMVTDVSTFQVSGVRAQQETLQFVLHYMAYRDDGWGGGLDSMELMLSTRTGHPAADGSEMFWIETTRPKHFKWPPDLIDLCPFRSDLSDVRPISTGNSSPFGFIILSPQVQSRIEAYLAAQKGFPSAASGSFLRMLYFSAITITTIGYGDIVAITPWARTLVGCEAVLGIVIIGLFLNAVAGESAEKALRKRGQNRSKKSALAKSRNHAHVMQRRFHEPLLWQ